MKPIEDLLQDRSWSNDRFEEFTIRTAYDWSVVIAHSTLIIGMTDLVYGKIVVDNVALCNQNNWVDALASSCDIFT